MQTKSKEAIEIIGELNFDKACAIICNSVSDRMPATIERLKNTDRIKPSDIEDILTFEGLTKPQIIDKLKQEIISRRDEIIYTYLEVFKKIDQISPNPALNKNLHKERIYESIIAEKDHFKTLSQFPSDWNNTELFGRLWGNAILADTFSLQDKGYKKHLTVKGFDFLQIPAPILEAYDRYQYQYVDINGFEVPVPEFSLLSLKYNEINISEILILEYAKGFVQGYHSNLIPFIDTQESRKEVVFIELFGKGAKGFPEYHNGNTITYRKEDLYESGVFEGKRYKAWEIIFRTPNEFIKWFDHSHQTEKNNEQKTENKKPKTFNDVFVENDCTKYLNVFVNCTPQLLNSQYEFVGNKKTQRGVVAAWFKYLKSKGIIDQSLNRNELAMVLSTQIKNYSIAGSSIDNESTLYKNIFEPQFIKLIK
jgi:hypothetical protein